MRSTRFTFALASLIVALALPVQLAAQHTRYKLIDMGTFGGPASYLTDPGNGPGFLVLNDAGVLVGRSDTSTFDPTLGDFRAHAFRWEKGVLNDLGTPAGAVFSQANGINAVGWIAIDYSAGAINPLTGGPVFRGALWKDGQFLDLGTLGGLETDALYVNNGRQVVGFSTIDTTPDPFSFLGATTHAFIWENGNMTDLGTLGGPDSFSGGGCVDERMNLVTGISFINSIPDPDLGGVPISHPFLWRDGKMIDLGTLGGKFLDPVQCANNQGQVTGSTTLAGDSMIHAYLWDHGVMHDLGTLGGDNSHALWLNKAGEVVGDADLPSDNPDAHHAFLWRNGAMIDLGTLGSTSQAIAINSNGQVVGRSRIGDPSTELQHAFLWENGGPMLDLNTLIPPNSPLELYDGENINDRGEIAGRGLPPGCDDKDACGHAFLLIPCENDTSCNSKADVATPASQQPAAVTNRTAAAAVQAPRTPISLMATWRTRLAQRYQGLAHKDW